MNEKAELGYYKALALEANKPKNLGLLPGQVKYSQVDHSMSQLKPPNPYSRTPTWSEQRRQEDEDSYRRAAAAQRQVEAAAIKYRAEEEARRVAAAAAATGKTNRRRWA